MYVCNVGTLYGIHMMHDSIHFLVQYTIVGRPRICDPHIQSNTNNTKNTEKMFDLDAREQDFMKLLAAVRLDLDLSRSRDP